MLIITSNTRATENASGEIGRNPYHVLAAHDLGRPWLDIESNIGKASFVLKVEVQPSLPIMRSRAPGLFPVLVMY